MELDLRTITIINSAVCILDFIVTGNIWLLYRKRFNGLGFWLLCALAQVVGQSFFVLTGPNTPPVIFLLQNVLILSGAVLFKAGVERFVGVGGRNDHTIALMSVYAGLYLLLVHFLPDKTAPRGVLFFLFNLIIIGQIVWLILQRTPLWLRTAMLPVGIILSAFFLIYAALLGLFARISLTPLTPADVYSSGSGQALLLLLISAVQNGLIIAKIMSVSQRLLIEVRAQEEKFSKAFHSSPNAIVLTRPKDGAIVEVNKGFVEMSGYSPQEAIGKTSTDLNIWLTLSDRDTLFHALKTRFRVQNYEVQLRKKSGELITGLYSADTVVVNGERITVSTISDITELSLMKQKLQIEATHDSLTGLPNRTLFFDRFTQASARADRHQQGLAVFSLDLDLFKQVNDSMGHAMGDALLVQIARRLVQCMRKEDTVARFGGDEFVLLVCEVINPEDAIKAAGRIIENFRAPFVVENHTLFVTTSLGIALYPQHGCDINELIKKSDRAMYLVKGSGKNNYHLYDEQGEESKLWGEKNICHSAGG